MRQAIINSAREAGTVIYDPIDHEDQRQARDHYRAVNRLIGAEDIKILDALLTSLNVNLSPAWDDLPEEIQQGLALLGDIVMPEGIGASEETFDRLMDERQAKAS